MLTRQQVRTFYDHFGAKQGWYSLGRSNCLKGVHQNMPGLSTHINFARLIHAEYAWHYDWFHFVLGTMAPDSFEPKTEERFRLYHFISDDNEIDLDCFQEAMKAIQQSGSHAQQSFVDGYYAHLWLDKYVDLHADDLRSLRLDGVDDASFKELFQSNIEQCDRVAINHFIESIQPSDPLPCLPSSLCFVSLDRVLTNFQDLMTSLKTVRVGEVLTIVIRPDLYMRFLSRAAEEFAGTVILDALMKAA